MGKFGLALFFFFTILATAAAQITAFEDKWHWGVESQAVYQEIVTSGPRQVADLIQALRVFLGGNDMVAYFVTMAIRLVERAARRRRSRVMTGQGGKTR